MNKKLYFLSGTMCDQRLWTSTWYHLEKFAQDGFEFIHLDIPTADDIPGILALLNEQIEPGSDVVGFSLGGYLATALTVVYPQTITRLLIVSNMPRALPQREIKERERTIKWLKTHGYSGIGLKRIQGLLHPKAHNNQDIINTLEVMDAELGVDTLMYQLKVTTKRESLLATLARNTVPVHFCIGQQDHLVDLDYLAKGVNRAQHLSLTTYDGVGHMFPLEAPEILAKEIHQFF